MSEATPFSPIAIDAMGSERGLDTIIAALKDVLYHAKDRGDYILVGRTPEIEEHLRAAKLLGHPRLAIHHASEVVGMDEKPKIAYKTKKDASMFQAIELVRSGRAGAAVSCGNTGCLQFASTLMLRKIPGVERPALATVMPRRDGRFVLIDAGAEPNTSARQLVYNAVMGNAYAEAVLPGSRPRVGLLTIGREEGKGTERVNEANALLRQLGDRINYVGLMEGFDVFQNVADVVVTDGFAGNILLKGVQSIFHALKHTVGEEIRANPIRKLGYLLVRGAFKGVTARFGPADYAGAPMLGLNGLVFKTHGSSNHEYIRGALRIARESQAHALVETTSEAIASALEALKVPSPLAATAV